LREWGYRLCLVSPELQGREKEIPAYKAEIAARGITFDAVCTKAHNIPQWQ